MRATNKNKDELYATVVAAQQLGSIIDIAFSKSKISKDHKQAPAEISQANDSSLVKSWETQGNCGSDQTCEIKYSKSTHTEAFAFADSPKSAPNAITYDKQSQKRVRQPTSEERDAVNLAGPQ